MPGLPVRPAGWHDEPWQFNLAKLIVGSEGTLAVAAAALLKVVPAPGRPGAGRVVVRDHRGGPRSAGRDRRDGPGRRRDARPDDPRPGGPEPVVRPASRTSPRDAPRPFWPPSSTPTRRRSWPSGPKTWPANSRDGRASWAFANDWSMPATDDFWKVRKAGFSLLMGMVGDAKPIAFVEDTAVDPAQLPAFYDRFRRIVERHGVRAACYGHADVGCLHIRPLINVKTRDGVETLRSIAREVSDLVVEFGGAMSGEHGDGLARSLWNRKLFGPEIYAAFQAVKRAFDPENRLNPGKVVGDADPGENLRIGPDYHPHEPHPTLLDFSNQGGFARAVEMCSGVGACRKTASGTMCPSYMVTRDEIHTTRGRANLLRLAMTGELPGQDDGLDNETLHEALDLCLQCKACKNECPSQVDMAKLKAEVLHQHYHNRPRPLSHLLLGQIFRLNPIAAATAPLTNRALRSPAFKWLLEKAAGIDRRRTLPTFAHAHFRKWFRGHQVDARAGERGSVVLLDDCFTTYNDPEVGIAAVRVLEASGYRVELAGLACCGRPAISKGLLPLARELATRQCPEACDLRPPGHSDRRLRAELPGDAHRRVSRIPPGARCRTGCKGLADDRRLCRRSGERARLAARALVAAACWFMATASKRPWSARRAHSPPCAGCRSSTVKELDSGCCGMAGSFGYEHGHYEVSEALANRVLIPAALADPEARLVAPGFSCRSQVHGLAGIEAVHPIEILSEQLRP